MFSRSSCSIWLLGMFYDVTGSQKSEMASFKYLVVPEIGWVFIGLFCVAPQNHANWTNFYEFSKIMSKIREFSQILQLWVTNSRSMSGRVYKLDFALACRTQHNCGVYTTILQTALLLVKCESIFRVPAVYCASTRKVRRRVTFRKKNN